ncbi:high affinity copper uptake protein 1 isoform X1 [Drosophila persimilis]|uniref:Copper transport protein n=1 Tax=Drosophila pseudoobscura pseudoobscura TaxID=46245 RepID=A0A0R3NY01_DROPS|nr:high affinity copper uptake protein 1 isoform X1 [Drosophila pseudoobscura]XP_015040896.1 high affinity copper uptake protein 1 isoform X1 [Drosophila pseudoobscura]XP_015040897.1 high affinity copper uptake protein 1 isoform X1 [Drosophila pseudoobscura]XP_026846695.1 high affinity copper uptake protein 1 isoform X1 [Drosophila persimilis]XP_026846696.1 high affinity copper uptake protein 1 isoform X1 [Drosophila persimilis]
MDHAHHTAPNVDHSLHHDHAGMHHDHSGMDSSISPTTTTTDSTTHDMHAVHHHSGGGGGTGTGMEHMMSMAFHFGYNETILFSWWHIDTVSGLIGSMIAIFLLALLYEGLKYYREYLFWKTYNLLEYRPVTGPQRNPEAPRLPSAAAAAPSPVQYVGEVVHKQPPSMLSVNHLYQTLLHILQVTLSFLLMLIFMTYNVWLCLMVVLGAAVGYFLFCWKKSVIVDVTEHCH